MKKIGIVGGVGWRSTVEYYTELCRRCEEWGRAVNRPGEPLTPDIAIESLDLNRAIALLGRPGHEASWAGFDKYHRAALRRLEGSGAQLALIASNTPHLRFASITRGIGIPVLSIFEAAAKAAARLGKARVLILGTHATMASMKLPESFAAHGIHAAAPCQESARAAIAALIDQLEAGAGEAVSARLKEIAGRAIDAQFGGDAAVCLACTELPLAFPGSRTRATFDCEGIRYINTTAAHIDMAFECAVSPE